MNELENLTTAERNVNGTNRYGQLMEKLSIGSSDFLVGNQSVLIDLGLSTLFQTNFFRLFFRYCTGV